jgi:CDP-diacylglycerol--glycerol-3-phosphate 3-phosphatidyltransferase
MYRQIPNLITLGRLLLTALFFAVIDWPVQVRQFPMFMWMALAVFILATASDALDGYLARSWKVESVFGRVVDPFADKILICGAFVFFSMPNFLPGPLVLPAAARSYSATGVHPWMAVLLIAREFLVTGLRGLAESRGIDFRALWTGKAKMVLQSLAVGSILLYLAFVTTPRLQGLAAGLAVLRDVLIGLTIAVTLLSAGQYIFRAWRVIEA